MYGQNKTCSLRDRLRVETRAVHAALEADLPIASGHPGRRIYRDHLQFLLGFHEPIEKNLRELADLSVHIPDAERRWKAPALRADLGTFDQGPRASVTQLPKVRTPAQALGVVYVTEGATLGARTLLPRLRDAGVVPGEIGARYLYGYGRRTASMWRRFCAYLEATDPADADAVIDAAKQTFDRLRCFRREWERDDAG